VNNKRVLIDVNKRFLNISMGRNKVPLKNLLKSYVKKFGSDVFINQNTHLYCLICEVKVNATKHSQVAQHIKTEKHI
jgi:hypothetical protein